MDYALYAKRMGEGLLGSLLEVGGSPKSPAGLIGVVGQGSHHPLSLASRLQPLIPGAGYVIFNPSGAFHEYLMRVEDAVILHLLRPGSAGRPEVYLGAYASAFLAAAAHHSQDAVEEAAYSMSSPISAIRMSIRIMACDAQLSPAELFNALDGVIASAGCPSLKRPALLSHATSLNSLAPLLLSFMSLTDDSVGNVVHVNRSQLPASAITTEGAIRAFALQVQFSGSPQLHGLYVCLPTHSVERPMYGNLNGYVISRERRSISLPHWFSSSASEQNPASEAIFVWYISSPGLVSAYFYCGTVEATPLPPLLGWRQCGVGKLPTPQLSIIDHPGPNSSKPASELALTQGLFVSTQLKFGPSQSDFCRLSRKYRFGYAVDACISERYRSSIASSLGSKDSDGCSDDGPDLSDTGSDSDGEDADMVIMGLAERLRLARRARVTRMLLTRSDTGTPLLVCERNSDELNRPGPPKFCAYVEDAASFRTNLSFDALSAQIALTEAINESDATARFHNTCQILERSFRQRLAAVEARRQWLGDANADSLTSDVPRSDYMGSDMVGAEFFNCWTLDGLIAKIVHDEPPAPVIRDAGHSAHSPQTVHHHQPSLSDLLEMALPNTRRRWPPAGTGIARARVSVLGVELWPPSRSTLRDMGSADSAPVKLCYVIRITLSDTSFEMDRDDENKGQSCGVSRNIAGCDVEAPSHKTERDSDDDDSSSIGMGCDSESIASGTTIPDDSAVQARLAILGSLPSFEAFAQQLVRRLASRIGIDSQHVFTVRRDLPSLCALHSELSRLLLVAPYKDCELPPFPDPFAVASVQEELLSALTAHTQYRPLRLGQAFVYCSGMRNKGDSAFVDIPPALLRSLDASAAQLEQYLESILVLMESIDEDCLPCASTNSVNGDCVGIESDIETNLSGSELGASDARPGTAHSPSSQYNGNAPVNLTYSFAHDSHVLSRRLGRLVGRFLQASDLEDIVDMRSRRNTEGFLGAMNSGGTERDDHGVGVVGDMDIAIPVSPQRRTSTAASEIEREEGLCGVADGGIEWSGRQGTLHVGERQIRVRRPSWYPFASTGLKLRLTVNDEQGGKLSLKTDEELLRGQRSKCLGCGEPLQSGFFGLERNFHPCRYHGGLFCKRWCHRDDHRVVPHRLLNYWDTCSHRVCSQAAQFLDEVWARPVLHLAAINPLLYEGLPALRGARYLRTHAMQLLSLALEADTISDEPDRARAAVSGLLKLGVTRIYLCVSQELYSMSDLLAVQSRGSARECPDLLPALQQLLDVLKS